VATSCWREDLIGSWSVDAPSTLICADYPDDVAPEPVVVYPKRRRRKNARKVSTAALAAWGRRVRERDGRCVVCGELQGLSAHHVWPKAEYPDLALEDWNGETRCGSCHRLAHMDLPAVLFAA
jgi:hypothetical protein